MHAPAMAAADFLSRLTQFLSFLREHPKLSCLLLLLLASPIYRILLYFTPLLLSTALCIFALITLAPYVTATDAEVERQSLLGADCYQRKKTSTAATSISKGEKGAGAHGNFSSSSFPPSSLSAEASTGAECSCASLSSSCAAENSWMSWMKGLNDIGRAWVESKLAEQGLALSEPANRETLLALIEGSFAEIVTVKEDHADIFSAGGNTVDVDNNVMQLMKDNMDDDVFRSNHEEEATKDPVQQTRYVADEVECLVENVGDVNGGSKKACVEEPLPVSVMENRVDEIAPQAEEQFQDAAVGGASDKNTTEKAALESKQDCSDASGTSSKQGISKLLSQYGTKMMKEKPLTYPLHESTLPVIDASSSAHTISMPKTPSRIPAPSKLLEASRKIFSREEQSKSMLPRAPFQTSSLGRVQSLKTSSAGSSAQSKLESTASAFKLPTKRFLERSKSVSGKEASKLGSSTSMEDQASAKGDKECKAAQGKVNVESNACEPAVIEDKDALVSVLGDFTDGIDGNGPKFDEDLEVEEAQALVQSELKMLEVELEEVAAKLPKLDGALAYQKTPVKPVANATTALLSPTRTPLRSNMTLFSASSVAK